jgi:large subunit ribosomal protein L17
VALITAEKIETSEPKAKELRPFIERMTTNAKKGTIASYRNVIRIVGPKPGKKLFTDIAPRYKTRAGGYTRITKLVARKGDGSARAYIEFI